MAVPDTDAHAGLFLSSYLPYLLRRADQTLSAPFYAQLDRAGVARSDWRVIAVLHESGPMGIVELASAALSPQPTVTHAVRRLEERKLVRRQRGTRDRRQRIVALTAAGTRLTTALIEDATRIQQDVLAGVDGLDQLIERLDELTTAIEHAVADRSDDERNAG